MRPIMEKMCLFESVKSGKITLCDLALMNDAITARDENMRRANEAASRKD